MSFATVPMLKAPADYQAFRISSDDSNRLVIVYDEIGDGVPFITCVEIFDVGGRTPPNAHREAFEQFFVLAGEGVAICGDRRLALRPGGCLVVPPGVTHVVENTGQTRLYTLTTMIPDEAFGRLIRNGTPDSLDEEDLAVLAGLSSGPVRAVS